MYSIVCCSDLVTPTTLEQMNNVEHEMMSIIAGIVKNRRKIHCKNNADKNVGTNGT